MVVVSFEYDEELSKWQPVVTGAADAIVARQAFSAVVLTLKELDSRLLNRTQVSGNVERFEITPAVW